MGSETASIKVYIANRPTYADIQILDSIRPLDNLEIAEIVTACGNGWRKVFNVYAKFLVALDYVETRQFQTWQAYRDAVLLQQPSDTALLFSVPDLASGNAVHIIMGRTYAKQLLKTQPQLQNIAMQWLDDDFAIHKESKLVICPYFDYRQLSNIKIIRLVDLVRPLLQKH